MSNFTKSIMYSTTVLAAGLVAIFAIYNTVSTQDDGSGVAAITPAAGNSEVSELGINFEGISDSASSATAVATGAISETATNALEGAAGDAVADGVSGAADAVAETASGAAEQVSDAASSIIPKSAADHDASQEVAETAADTAEAIDPAAGADTALDEVIGDEAQKAADVAEDATQAADEEAGDAPDILKKIIQP